MAKPSSRILVINDEHLVLREFVKGLNAAARTLDNPLGISFIGVTTATRLPSGVRSQAVPPSLSIQTRGFSGTNESPFTE